jgi:hypothetical protein
VKWLHPLPQLMEDDTQEGGRSKHGEYYYYTHLKPQDVAASHGRQQAVVHPVIKDDCPAHGERHIHERSGGGGGGTIPYSTGRMGVVCITCGLERMEKGGHNRHIETRHTPARSVIHRKIAGREQEYD